MSIIPGGSGEARVMGEAHSIDQEILFGRLIVDQGMARPEQVEECLLVLHDLLAKGAVMPKLGELMVRKGYLTLDQLRKMTRLADAIRSVKPDVLSPSQKLTLPPEAAMAWRNPANLVGKYIRVARIGSGGSGDVWKVWDPELCRWSAIKFLKHSDDSEIARFKREAQTAAKLNHPNICGVYEVGEHEGRPYIVMQYVDGITLYEFPRGDRRLLIKLLRDGALAVHYAHQQGIIHRDIKPSNFIVEGDPKEGSKTGVMSLAEAAVKGLRIYVMDFGLAKSVHVSSSPSQPGLAIGTPSYMSPEQARGDISSVGVRSDAYSLGATLYELLTDRPPFRHSDVYELLKRVIHEEPVPPRKLNPDVGDELDSIVLKAMRKEPALRYQSAMEFADELTRWLQGEPVRTKAPLTKSRVQRRIVERRPMRVVAITIGVLAAALLWMTMSWMIRSGRGAEEERKRAVAALERSARKTLAVAGLVRRSGESAEIETFLQATEQECEEAQEFVPESAEPHWYHGRILRMFLREERALEEQYRALQKEPGHVRALYERTVLLTDKHHRRLVLAWGEALLQKLEADETPLPALEAREWNESDAALKSLRNDLRRDLELLDKITAGKAGSLAAAEATYVRAVREWLRGNPAGADELGRQALRESPSLVEGHQLGAMLKVEQGDAEGALRRWNEALRRERGYVPFLEGKAATHLGAAVALWSSNRDAASAFQAALDDLNLAHAAAPTRANVRLLRGLLFWAEGRWQLSRRKPAAANFKSAREDFVSAVRLTASLQSAAAPFLDDCARRLER